MIDMNRSKFPDRYEVRVGFSRVCVEGRSPVEAVEQARRQLSLEMPRLYDVIYGLEAERFEVERIS